MDPDDAGRTDPEARLNLIMAEYLKAVDRGQAPDRAALIDRHPDLAAELNAFFVDHDRIRRLAEPLRAIARDDRTEPADAPAEDVSITTTPGDEPGTTQHGEGSRGNGVAPAFPRGTTVRYIGDYQIVREIARGGMGIVYRAHQLSLDRAVALKMILAGAFASEADRRRFHTEAEAVAQLDHPNIVAVHEVGDYQGHDYFSMQLIEGEGLDRHLDRFLADPRGVAELLAAVARAVHHAHQRGVLHRDLKPSNILLDAQGRPHVTDFGLAKRLGAADHLTRTGDVMGSPPYMSPEQAAGHTASVTTATDVYGLGAVLYAMLTGRAPFGGETLATTLDAVQHRAPEPPSRTNPRVPRDLETICLTCLAKDPARRYASAAAVADDLGRWLRGEPIAARPVGRLERAKLWIRRNRTISTLAALVLLSLLVGTAVSLAFALRARRNAVEARRLATEAQDERDRIARLRYDAEINLAYRDLEANNFDLVERRLADLETSGLPPADRGFEWGYLKSQLRPSLRVLSGPGIGSGPVAFSPDGRLLATAVFTRFIFLTSDANASAERDEGIRLLEVATGRELKRLLAPVPASEAGRRAAAATLRGGVNALSFSPDGRLLAAAGGLAVWVFEIESGRLRAEFDGRALAVFSPDGRLIATAGPGGGEEDHDSAVRLLDASTGRELRRLPRADREPWTGVVGLAFSPDGSGLFISYSDGTVQRRDVASGAVIARFREPHERILTFSTGALALSPDGARLAGAVEAGSVHVWDAVTGRGLAILRGHLGGIEAVAYSPDGRLLASAGQDGTVRLWDGITGREAGVLKGHSRNVRGLAFGTGGRLLASSGIDDKVRIWDVGPGREPARHASPGYRVETLSFSPDGRLLASAGSGVARVWEVATGREHASVRGVNASTDAAFFRKDGTLLLSEDGAFTVWDVNTSRERARFRKPPGSGMMATDGRTLALGPALADEYVPRLQDLESGRSLAPLRGCDGDWLAAFAFSPDGRFFGAASMFADCAFVWDIRSGGEPMVLGQNPKAPRSEPVRARNTRALAFSPDGKRLATVFNQGIQVWDLRKPRMKFTLRGHRDKVSGIAFSPDSRRLATGSEDGTLKVWDVTTGRELTTFREHENWIAAVAFSPDGQFLATAGLDGTVRLHASEETSESPAQREAVGFVRFHVERAASAEDLGRRIRDDGSISEDVRGYALSEAEAFWKSEKRRRAEATVGPLFSRPMLREEVVAALERDDSISPELRVESLEQAARWPEQAGGLMQEAWQAVRRPHRPEAEYRRALRCLDAAEPMLTQNADRESLAVHRGACLYRLGRDREAIASLERSREDYTRPKRLAFLAMSHQRLGDSRKAREFLDCFRRDCAGNDIVPWDRALLPEALILYDPGFPAGVSAFASPPVP
ncbi:MAG: serine/threonine-protein kinase [Isosphaeraceae bacterium]